MGQSSELLLGSFSVLAAQEIRRISAQKSGAFCILAEPVNFAVEHFNVHQLIRRRRRSFLLFEWQKLALKHRGFFPGFLFRAKTFSVEIISRENDVSLEPIHNYSSENDQFLVRISLEDQFLMNNYQLVKAKYHFID